MSKTASAALAWAALAAVLGLQAGPARAQAPTDCPNGGPVRFGVEPFEAVLDVTEPMGMETLIYFTLEGAQICGRVNPNAGARDGEPLRLAVDLNNMHLLNEGTGVVL